MANELFPVRTIATYFEAHQPITEYRLKLQEPIGLTFCGLLHPANADGETLDFIVSGNKLIPLLKLSELEAIAEAHLQRVAMSDPASARYALVELLVETIAQHGTYC